MTAPSDPQRCQCGTNDCKGFVSQYCEASPKQCSRADGCDCPFHSAEPPKKRGKHSKASSRSYLISQDVETYELLWRMCCLMFSPDVLQRRTQSANVRWFAAQLMRLAQHSADEPGHGENLPQLPLSVVLLLPRDQTNQSTVEKLPQLPISAMICQRCCFNLMLPNLQ